MSEVTNKIGAIQTVVSLAAMLGATALVMVDAVSGQEAMTAYTLVLGYIFGVKHK